MKPNKLFKNKLFVLSISIVIVLFIGFLDFITGSEVSFVIFYLIPVLLVAIYTGPEKTITIMFAFFASGIWLVAEYLTREYLNSYAPIWNAFVRFSTFLIIGLLALNLKEKYNKLLQANIDLIDLNVEKNRFIGVASHDLRNPISNIFSFSDLLISEYSHSMDAQILEIVGYIKELSSNTLEMLRNLLDISKIESGIVHLSPKMHDYIAFIEKHIYMNLLLANKKQIKINLETSEKELLFKFDEQYLGEVIDNLLTNAIKYSFENSEVLVRISVSADNYVKTEVIDTGKGIAANEQNDLFKYFQKTSTTPTAGESSTGLGLAIAKKIVTEHNGKIGVISELKKGSNFYYELSCK